jgi:SAM-dependent methyltransferase
MSDTGGSPRGNTYDKYHSTNPIERRLMARFERRLDALLPPTAASVLEVGTGEGRVLTRLRRRYPDARLVGLDLPAPELTAEWGAGVGWLYADATALPFADATFDLVLAVEVLEHVASPPLALAELARVARHHVVVSVPREPLWRVLNMARGAYLRQFGNTPGHVNHWGRRGFVRFVGSALPVAEVRSALPWTLVAATAGRPGGHRRAGPGHSQPLRRNSR